MNFSWVPAWTYLLLFGGIWPWVLFYLIFRRAMEVELPLCGRHRRHFFWRRAILPVGLVATLAVMILPAVADPDAKSYPPTWAFAAASAIFIGTIAVAVWLVLTGVRATRVTRQDVTLAGVAPGFVTALEAGREEYERRKQEWLGRYDRAAGPS